MSLSLEQYLKANQFLKEHPMFEHLLNLYGYFFLGLKYPDNAVQTNPDKPKDESVEHHIIVVFSRLTNFIGFLGAQLGYKNLPAVKPDVNPKPWESKFSSEEN